ncbi:aminoglycoside phosphotransferase family protein [Streptomyces sp. NPDC059002]|uniref:aminoglycoside phosphotransferase family protein n=1 Tax=Streptomyces sp. NPDC059002 TaxID=3346690 RepID=UPI00367929C0
MGDSDRELVRSMLREQHPDLADLDLRLVDGGSDNQLWRLGDDLAVRLPRTPRAPSLLRNEHQWLPALAPRLPLPVPVPLRIGEPTARFPMPWTVAAWVPGEPADRAVISRAGHAAETLAAFLGALHENAPTEAPTNPDRGVPLKSVAAGVEAAFQEFTSDDLAPDTVRALRAVWQDAVTAPAWEGPPRWLHGDLHPANVLVDDGTLAGVIDFGEVCAGDPATDLAAAWLLLPEGGAAPFFDAYGRADGAAVRRARGWAVRRALDLISVGRAGDLGRPGGKPTWGPAGRGTLDRVLASV